MVIPEIVYETNGGISYLKSTRTFLAEASTLGLSNVPHHLRIRIAKNGHTKIFNILQHITDLEGEVLWWEYKSACGKFKIKVFND